MGNDLICRGELLQKVQADDESDEKAKISVKTAKNMMRTLTKSVPAVDAVIPVRCGKCMNWDTEKLYCHHPAGLSYCGKKAAEEGFCCFGERRADE